MKMKRAWRQKHNNGGVGDRVATVSSQPIRGRCKNRNAALALCLETRENDRHQRQSRRWWRDSSRQLLARVDDHRPRVSGVPLSSLVTTSPIVLESRFQRIPRSFRITTYESMIITRRPPPGFTRNSASFLSNCWVKFWWGTHESDKVIWKLNEWILYIIYIYIYSQDSIFIKLK